MECRTFQHERWRVFGLLVAGALVSLAFAFDASAREAKETVLYNFTCGIDGCGPFGPLARDAVGNLYGTTAGGGDLSCNCGTVFELTPNSGGGWTETVLHSFTGGADGMIPQAGVILDAAGNLFGTTSYGGNGTGCGNGCGTVFELVRSNGTWTETVLYSFLGFPDGAAPGTPLLIDKAGNLYGATYNGGSGCPTQGCGSIFELTSGPSSWAEKVLYNFTGGRDGRSPSGSLVFDYLGDIYGTAGLGVYDFGTVFRLAPSSNGWTESTIWSFTGGEDGAGPNGVIVHKGALYGTTDSGGENHVGTVFQLTPAVGNWTMHVIHTFSGNNDGGVPFAGLIAGQSDLYGTTFLGGYYQSGTVFRLAPPSGGGEWTETVLYNFTGGNDGGNPNSQLSFGPGSLFGVAGGGHGGGPIFEITAH